MKSNMEIRDMTTLLDNALLTHGVMALFGATAHAIRAHRLGESKGFADFFLLTLMSSFSGVVFALVAAHAFDNQYITLASAGAGGFLGVEALSIVAITIRDSLVTTLTKK